MALGASDGHGADFLLQPPGGMAVGAGTVAMSPELFDAVDEQHYLLFKRIAKGNVASVFSGTLCSLL